MHPSTPLDASPPLIPHDSVPVDLPAVVAACRAAAALETERDARRFLAEQGLEMWGALSLTQVGAALGLHVWGGQSFASSLVHAFYSETAREALRTLLEATRRAETYDREAHPRRRAGPSEPDLRGAHDLLMPLYEVPHRATPLLHRLRATLRVDPPALQHPSGAVLTFSPLRIEQPTAEAVASFLDVLTGTEPALVARRERLRVALATPRTARDLQVLVKALAPRGSHDELADKPRVGWVLKDAGQRWQAVAVRCGRKANGSWALKEVGRDRWGPGATPLDEAVEAHASLVGRLVELRDHPLVFVRQGRRCDGVPRRVRRVTLGLGLVDAGDTTEVRLEVEGEPVPPDALVHPDRIDRRWWLRVTPTEVQLAAVPAAVERVHELLVHRGGLHIEDGGALLRAMPSLGRRVALRADPGTLGAARPCDPRPLLGLQLDDDGLVIEARVLPLPDVPASLPGEGAQVLVAERDGEVVHVRRDLTAEPASVRQALAPLGLGDGDGWRWRITDHDRALDTIERIRTASDRFQVRWSGPRPTLAPGELGAQQLAIRVGQGHDWFGLQGEATVAGQTLDLATLLEAAGDGRRWVPLSEGQWVKLSEALQRPLAAAAVVAGAKAGEPRLSMLQSRLLAPLVDDGAALDAPDALHRLDVRCREAAALQPSPPEGLHATLRPYQLEGFRWLARLAHWAPGACLADDMGLGKTLQSIALLLHRREGMALVVAPTSLLGNWERELQRFAPDLVPRRYHGAGRRLEPRPGEVWLTTYGVLVHDAEVLQATAWSTVVLDEAQAIKNPSSRRARAAHALPAGFRIALSGTPVENRTAELWSLMAFVAPGLLGPAGRFRSRFVQAIEAQGDTDRREQLAQLVAPFVLRRTKAAVAPDLPDRIELVERVELSDAERALYDHTRRQGLGRLHTEGGRMAVLEELLRLRKLACHPRLLDASSQLESSKLRAIRRRLNDLRDAGQRSLVFSTFTSHLALVREALETDGFRVRYLDGSMSAARRLDEVDAFQAGDGDVFLISTKAGGVGLNLTAATAVLHIDPWWNPAAEDQATDRAHRIGQTEPVTVVRLVAADTIEEQIVALHATKRALADALLAHADHAGPVTLDDLMALLSEEGSTPASEAT